MRIRAIKPGFFKNAELYDAEKACGLPLRVAFAGLWCVADRMGRFKWKPREIKSDVLPHDDCDMAAVMNALAKAGFILKYKCAGEEYGLIPKFSVHQHVNTKEAASTIPAPDEHSNSRAKRVKKQKSTIPAPDEHPMEGKGRELVVGKGKEGDSVPNGTADAGAPPAVTPKVDSPPGKPEWWPKRDRYGRVTTEITDKLLFDLGKSVLGQNAGGQITKLRGFYRHDLRACADIVLQADEKSDPREWFAAVLRRAQLDELVVPQHEKFPDGIYREIAS